MRILLLIDIAMTLLRARLRQTIVAAVGVMFGITMFITLLSFMTGLNSLLDGLIINRTPHIRLFNEVKPLAHQPIAVADPDTQTYHFISSIRAANSRQSIYNAAKIMETLRQDERVAGIGEKVNAQVFFNVGTLDITGVLNGINVETEIKFYNFKDYVTTGNPYDLLNIPNSIILGKPLAEKLMANVGDIVQVTTAQGERFQFKVVGYYQSGLADFDKTQTFTTTPNVQKILGKPATYFTDIQIKLKDLASAPQVGKEYARKFEVEAEDIQTANAQFETGTTIRTIISYTVGITLLIVAGFGIYNILNMMIYEKMDTIAILKATGFAGRDVKTIFMLISITIGIMGCIGGLIAGYVLSSIIDQVPFETAALPTVKTYPVNYNPVFYGIAIVFSLLTTYLAGFFPARKASKIDPVIIIRGK